MRARPFVLTPQARQDLIDTWIYIAEDSIDNADRVLQKLRKAFSRLARNPGIGHHREDLADDRHRFWAVYSYVIVYLPARYRKARTDEQRRGREAAAAICRQWQHILDDPKAPDEDKHLAARAIANAESEVGNPLGCKHEKGTRNRVG